MYQPGLRLRFVVKESTASRLLCWSFICLVSASLQCFERNRANSHGNAFPMIRVTASILSTGKEYSSGKVCNAAASRTEIVRSSLGCPKRPMLSVTHPLVIVGDASSSLIRPYALLYPLLPLVWQTGRKCMGITARLWPGLTALNRSCVISLGFLTTCQLKSLGHDSVLACDIETGADLKRANVCPTVRHGSNPFRPNRS